MVVDPLRGIPVSYCLSYGPLILFSKVSSASLISQSGSSALPVVITPAIYSEWWATMDTASGPEIRGTSFRAIPQSTKIMII